MIENEDDRLINMLFTQLDFQKKLLEKRHTISPDDVMIDTSTKLAEACYHATCTNVELAEFIEQLYHDNLEKTDDVIFTSTLFQQELWEHTMQKQKRCTTKRTILSIMK